MKTTEINPNAISTAAGVIPENVPIIMVNLLRYKEHANYGNRTDIAPCSGREAYFQHYVSAFNKIAAEIEGTDGIRPFYVSTVLAQLAAPTDEKWDDVILVEYPSFAVFRSVVENPRYNVEAAHHRAAALDDWRLIATIKKTMEEDSEWASSTKLIFEVTGVFTGSPVSTVVHSWTHVYLYTFSPTSSLFESVWTGLNKHIGFLLREKRSPYNNILVIYILLKPFRYL